jgi:hypothetical protein
MTQRRKGKSRKEKGVYLVGSEVRRDHARDLARVEESAYVGTRVSTCEPEKQTIERKEYAPSPNLPTPALLETQVRPLTSERFERAPMIVSVR